MCWLKFDCKIIPFRFYTLHIIIKKDKDETYYQENGIFKMIIICLTDELSRYNVIHSKDRKTTINPQNQKKNGRFCWFKIYFYYFCKQIGY